jgi:hypothetical protein
MISLDLVNTTYEGCSNERSLVFDHVQLPQNKDEAAIDLDKMKMPM